MKKLAFIFITLTFLPLMSLAETVSPGSSEQCSRLVKECFAAEGNEQTNCFFSSSTHPFCEGTEIGKLSYKRWSLSPDSPALQQGAPSLLGPQMLDNACVANCDSALVAAMIEGPISRNQIEISRACYDKCVSSEQEKLPTP